MLLFLLLAVAAGADTYKEVALFADSGLVIRIEYRSDGDRRGLLIFEKAGALFFRPGQWKAVRQSLLTAMDEAPRLAVGAEGAALSVESAGGSKLQVRAVRPVRVPGVVLTVPPKGGKVVLEARQFTRLRAALAEVDQALR